MVIHVIFAFASVRHNGTPSRCSTVTVITTLHASVGMRSEFDITPSFIIWANVKWLIHQKTLSRLQMWGFISKAPVIKTLLLSWLPISEFLVFPLMGLDPVGLLICRCPKQEDSICLLAYICDSHMSKSTWWKGKSMKRCSATSRFCWAYMQSADLRALSHSWVSVGRAIICVSNRMGRRTQTVITPPTPLPPQ